MQIAKLSVFFLHPIVDTETTTTEMLNISDKTATKAFRQLKE